MRKFFTLGLSILLLSCLSEDSVDPGSSATFIRYFNGGNNDEARGMEMTPDGGFMLLATTRIQKQEADIPRTKIKVVKTDDAGNPLWQQLYPDFSDATRDYLASAIQATSTGYLIIGDVIESGGASKTLVLSIDKDGNVLNSLDLAYTPGVAEKGRAITVDAAGNFVALSTQGTDKMIITQIDKTTFQAVLPQREHLSGQTTLANRLLMDPAGKVVISGMRTLNGQTGIRLLRTLPDSPTTDYDLFKYEPGYSFAGFDFCAYGTGYAVAGSTNFKPGSTPGTTDTDPDVLFFLMDSEGNTLRFATFPFNDPNTPQDEDNQIDAGNAVAATSDGGLIFLSSINSSAIEGRGDTEFYLIKIDAFGNKVWTSSFGSRFKDEGVAIRQLTDGSGSFVALGTTTQGSLKILTLFKTDKDGKIY